MEAHTVIRHKLDLVLRLINSVDGRVIEERNAQFLSPSIGLKAIPRGGGVYLFLNMERVDFEIEIQVYGYESQKVKIAFLEKDERLPIHEVYLLPLDNPVRDTILTLRGHLSGIEKVEAVSLMDVNCCIKEFDATKKIMTVLNQRNLRFHHTHYGLLNQSRTAYEHFELAEEISLQEIRCKQALTEAYQVNQPIVRVVFGQADVDGNYILKVANDENPLYLVRYVVNGNVFFQKMDFSKKDKYLDSHEEREERWE